MNKRVDEKHQEFAPEALLQTRENLRRLGERIARRREELILRQILGDDVRVLDLSDSGPEN